MSDLEDFYRHAAECAKTLHQAFSQLPAHKMTVSRARRCLARARTAFGEPEVAHQRRVRLCRTALQHLEQAIVNFETDAPITELASGLRQADRSLRRVQVADLGCSPE